MTDSLLELDGSVLCESLEASDDDNDLCTICGEAYRSPRLLRCLHAFCEACVQRQHEEDETDSGSVACRRCHVATRLDQRGAAALPVDYVTANLRDMQLAQSGGATCTGCRAAPVARARCADCAHFLCAGCLQTHQKSAGLQGHHVLTLEELDHAAAKNPIPIHRPVTCVHHPDATVTLVCVTCKVAACEQCPLGGGPHRPPEHMLRRICDVEKAEWGDFLNAIELAKSKRRQAESAGDGVQSALQRLQQQHEEAVQQLDTQLAAAQQALQLHHQQLRARVDQLHRERRTQLWDAGERCQTDREQLQLAIRLADRLLEFGNSAELLQLKPTILERVRLSSGSAQPADARLQLLPPADTAERAVKRLFGHFAEDEPAAAAPPPAAGPTAARLPEATPLGSRAYNGHAPTAPGAAAGAQPLRQTSTVSPVEADMPTFNAGYHSLPSPSLPSPVSGLAASSSGIGSSLSSLGLATGPSPPPPPAAAAAAAAAAHHIMFDRSQSYPAPECALPLPPELSGSQMALHNIRALARLGSCGPGVVSGGAGGDLLDTYLPNRPPAHLPAPADLTATAYPLPPLPGAGDAVMGRPGLSLRDSPLLTPTPHNGLAMPLTMSGGGGAVSPTQRPRGLAAGVASMQIRAKFGQLGQMKSQFNSPHGFCLGVDEEIIVADTNNHRIQMFDKRGEFRHSFGVPGKDEGQLWYPRKVAVLRASGKFVVCDRGSERSRMQIFSRNGYFVRKISIRCIDIVAGLAISAAGHIVVVDSVTPTVFVIAENGSLIKWFDCSNYMREPSDIAVNGNDYYICDFKNHCVVVFDAEGQFLRRLGSESITNFPNGIDVSDAGDVLIGDSHGNKFHVAVFSRSGQLLSEFECPHVKVSRCCGLKLTHEGYIITIAKNNHHVLVLNTLYIP